MTDQFSVSGRCVFCAQRAGVGGLCCPEPLTRTPARTCRWLRPRPCPDGSYALEYAITQLREEGKAAAGPPGAGVRG